MAHAAPSALAAAAPPSAAPLRAALVVIAATAALRGAAIVPPLGGGRAPAARVKTVHVIDALPYVYRGYYALPDSIEDPVGRQSNALVGFSKFLVEYVLIEKPTHVALCFDCSTSSASRKRLYADYKSNRPKVKASFLDQLQRCRKFAEALGVKCFDSKHFEADDVIATLSTGVLSKGHRCTVVTVDKDLCQLVEPRLSVYDYARGKRYDEAAVVKKFGVRPCQVADMLGLVGDSADCIPGVRGIGAKTAAQLLRQFEDLDAMYAGLDQVATLGLRGAEAVQRALAAGREIALLSRRLATLERKVPVQKASIRGMLRGRPSGHIHKLLDDFGLQSLRPRVDLLQHRMHVSP